MRDTRAVTREATDEDALLLGSAKGGLRCARGSCFCGFEMPNCQVKDSSISRFECCLSCQLFSGGALQAKCKLQVEVPINQQTSCVIYPTKRPMHRIASLGWHSMSSWKQRFPLQSPNRLEAEFCLGLNGHHLLMWTSVPKNLMVWLLAWQWYNDMVMWNFPCKSSVKPHPLCRKVTRAAPFRGRIGGPLISTYQSFWVTVACLVCMWHTSGLIGCCYHILFKQLASADHWYHCYWLLLLQNGRLGDPCPVPLCDSHAIDDQHFGLPRCDPLPLLWATFNGSLRHRTGPFEMLEHWAWLSHLLFVPVSAAGPEHGLSVPEIVCQIFDGVLQDWGMLFKDVEADSVIIQAEFAVNWESLVFTHDLFDTYPRRLLNSMIRLWTVSSMTSSKKGPNELPKAANISQTFPNRLFCFRTSGNCTIFASLCHLLGVAY